VEGFEVAARSLGNGRLSNENDEPNGAVGDGQMRVRVPSTWLTTLFALKRTNFEPLQKFDADNSLDAGVAAQAAREASLETGGRWR